MAKVTTISDKDTAEYNNIIACINDVYLEFELSYCNSISKLVKKLLQENGFTVSKNDSISWEKAKKGVALTIKERTIRVIINSVYMSIKLATNVGYTSIELAQRNMIHDDVIKNLKSSGFVVRKKRNVNVYTVSWDKATKGKAVDYMHLSEDAFKDC